MSFVSTTYYQYRTFEHLYLVKVIDKNLITLRIFDLSQKFLFKESFSSRGMRSFQRDKLLENGKFFSSFFEKLIAGGFVPQEYRISRLKEATAVSLEKDLQQIIDQFKPHVTDERRESENLTCPISLEIFREPVIDDHGHTFEKSEIERHLKIKSECPISREPIRSLIPNRIVRDTIEAGQKQDPIPTFSLFQKENPKLAEANLRTAQAHAEEKEYQEALECYTRAFQYTKNWTDYVGLPLLFEKMDETKKANLASLYLAQYQLQQKAYVEAIQVLENRQHDVSIRLQIDLLLIKLYEFVGQGEKTIRLACQTAASLSLDRPEQATSAYKQILEVNPTDFPLYSQLATLLNDPHEKTHVLLKGACHALITKNYEIANRLHLEAAEFSKDSFLDQMIFLELLEKQEGPSRLTQELLNLAQVFEEKGLILPILKAYKRLFQLEKKPQYCQKIVAAYAKLQKPQQELQWMQNYLSLLIEKEEWTEAEKIAQELLQKVDDNQKILLYEKLEKIYSHWQGHKLEDLWAKLGKAYHTSQQLAAAERTYQKAFRRFSNFQQAVALAEVLGETGKIQESIHTYYAASQEALVEQDTAKVSFCVREIKKLDPQLNYLDANQKMHLLTQLHILTLGEKLQKAEQKIEALEKFIHPLQKKALEEERKRLEEEQEIKRQEELERKKQKEAVQFGGVKWEKYFGSVGFEPSLPQNIDEILDSPCPFWPNKRVYETHYLVLIPYLDLKTLQILIRNPKSGYKTILGFDTYDKCVENELGVKQQNAHWLLITQGMIPDSLGKYAEEHQKIVEHYARTSGISYDIPTALEAATTILIEYVQTGKRLYANDKYILCKEKVDHDRFPVCVGEFSEYRLKVFCRQSSWNYHSNAGTAAVWRLNAEQQKLHRQREE